MLVVLSHAYLVEGNIHEPPVHVLINELINLKKDFILIRHSLDGKMKSKMHFYENGELKNTSDLIIPKTKILPLVYIIQYVVTVALLMFKLKGNKNKIIGVNPLNALVGVTLKLLKKADKNIYYTTDFSPIRFKNKLMDKLFKLIDKICVFNSTEVLNVSSRITDIRKKMGLADSKNVLFPNNPPLYLQKKYYDNKRNKFSIVTIGGLDDSVDYMGFIDAIEVLLKKYSQIKFSIVGSGSKEDYLKKYVKEKGLENIVLFLGYLPLEKYMEVFSKSGVGVALYNGSLNFNYYGDSTKCREFFSFGLPVLSTNTHSTVEDIVEFKTGVVCETNTNSYVKGIEKIYNNYDFFSKNGLNLYLKYEKLRNKKLHDL